jgi:hypothetical protein
MLSGRRPPTTSWTRGLAALLAVSAAAVAGGTDAAPAARPITTAVFDPGAYVSSTQARAFERVRATGARMVRLTL